MRLTLTLLFSLLLPVMAQAATKVYTKGLQVADHDGLIRIVLDSGQEVKVRKGLNVSPGTTVYTGPKSKLTLSSKDGDRYQLGENSILKISPPIKDRLRAALAPKPTSRNDTLRFIRGRLDAFVKPGAPERVRISTSLSVLSVKGTTFRVTYDSRSVTLEVFEGIVEMESFAGERVEVIGGMWTDTNTWQTRKIEQERRKKLDIEVIQPTGPEAHHGMFRDELDIETSVERPTPNVNVRENAVFNWSTFDLEIEINHPSRNPSHQRTNTINVLPPTPPNR